MGLKGMELTVRFYRTASGSEPVRDWLREQPLDIRRTVGTDIKTVQIGWPLGMPLVRKMAADLWEIRSRFSAGIARVLFTVVRTEIVLLHGFIKKSEATPLSDLAVARKRHSILRGDS